MSIFILFWGDYLGNLNSNSQNKTHGLLYFQVENKKKDIDVADEQEPFDVLPS